jgi:uracil permease
MKRIILGCQMLFVAFGALVLVPILVGFDPSVALFTAGLGTLIFQAVTKRKVPIFLASSFAYIAPIIAATKIYGLSGALCGLVAAGFGKIILGLLVKKFGIDVIKKYLPAIVVGPVIIIIGLSLAPVAVEMAAGNMFLAFVSLLVAILVIIFGKGLLKLIPIIAGIFVGYLVALPLGVVDFSPVVEASWFQIPNFVLPRFSLGAIIFMVPVAIAPTIEHFGDILAISGICKKDFLKDPGLDRTLLGDGLATSAAGLLGGPPNTTYSEVSGAVLLLKATDPKLMTIAAVFSIILSFIGKLGAFLQTIPVSIMGGIEVLLFGMIANIGLQHMIKYRPDMAKERNLIIGALMLVIGIGGVAIHTNSFQFLGLTFGEFTLEGIGLAGVIGVILNIVLPQKIEINADLTEEQREGEITSKVATAESDVN